LEYAAGDKVEVYSVSSKTWVAGSVKEIINHPKHGRQISVEYGRRTKISSYDSPNIRRPLAQEATVRPGHDGDIESTLSSFEAARQCALARNKQTARQEQLQRKVQAHRDQQSAETTARAPVDANGRRIAPGVADRELLHSLLDGGRAPLPPPPPPPSRPAASNQADAVRATVESADTWWAKVERERALDMGGQTLDAKVTTVKEFAGMPALADVFVAECLVHYNGSVEEVVEALLMSNLPPHLAEKKEHSDIAHQQPTLATMYPPPPPMVPVTPPRTHYLQQQQQQQQQQPPQPQPQPQHGAPFATQGWANITMPLGPNHLSQAGAHTPPMSPPWSPTQLGNTSGHRMATNFGDGLA